jgi:hypothetical protein
LRRFKEGVLACILLRGGGMFAIRLRCPTHPTSRGGSIWNDGRYARSTKKLAQWTNYLKSVPGARGWRGPSRFPISSRLSKHRDARRAVPSAFSPRGVGSSFMCNHLLWVLEAARQVGAEAFSSVGPSGRIGSRDRWMGGRASGYGDFFSTQPLGGMLRRKVEPRTIDPAGTMTPVISGPSRLRTYQGSAIWDGAGVRSRASDRRYLSCSTSRGLLGPRDQDSLQFERRHRVEGEV